MKILIPSRGRPDGCAKKWLPGSLTVGGEDYCVIQLPPRLVGGAEGRRDGWKRGLTDSRQWITQEFGKCIQVDDDLKFHRLGEAQISPRESAGGGEMWPWLREGLKQMWEAPGVGYAGMQPRMFAQTLKDNSPGWSVRCTAVHMVDPGVLDWDVGPEVLVSELGKERPLRWDLLPAMEDLYLQLALAWRGLGWWQTRVCVWNQKGGTNARGGCSEDPQRADIQEYCAKRMEELFPGWVKAVYKHRNDWDRWDIRINWREVKKRIPGSPTWDVPVTENWWWRRSQKG